MNQYRLHNLYGRKIFIADLILTTIWALLLARYSSPGLMLLIPIRIALCFEMDRKSRWTLISSLGFLIAYLSAPIFTRPFEGLIRILLSAVGEAGVALQLFSHPLSGEGEAWLYAVSILGFIWLAIMPVIVGISFRNIGKIAWEKKGIWIYLAPLTLLCVWIMFAEGPVGGVLLGLTISFLPALYWSLYNRRGRSPIQLLLNNGTFRRYLNYVALLLAAGVIGLGNNYTLKAIGLMILPPLFYIILVKSLRIGIVLTRCCAALSVSGLLCYLSLEADKITSIVLLVSSGLLILYVGITMISQQRRLWAAVLLVLSDIFILMPLTFGLNPYILPEADAMVAYASPHNTFGGIYRITSSHDSAPYPKYGLRNRYGLILPMKYVDLRALDCSGRYVLVNAPVGSGSLLTEQRYGVFDLSKRDFIVDPTRMEVLDIQKEEGNSFKLIDPSGKNFATLWLRGEYEGRYYEDAHVEPD